VHKIHHPKPDIDRLYVTRSERVRGFLEIEAAYKAEINSTAEQPKKKYKENEFFKYC